MMDGRDCTLAAMSLTGVIEVFGGKFAPSVTAAD